MHSHYYRADQPDLLLLKFFARDKPARISDEHQQYLNSLAVKSDRDAVLVQLLRRPSKLLKAIRLIW